MLSLANLRQALFDDHFGTKHGLGTALEPHNGLPIGLKTTLLNGRAFTGCGQPKCRELDK